jgi:outer membrane receptor protein involved in Fe transport
LLPGLRLKANYLRAYRRPNFSELFHPDYGFIRGNPTLDPEDAWNFDVGFELARDSAGPLSELRAEGVFFHRDVDESIEWMLVINTSQPVNTGRARARGYEARLSLRLFELLRLSGSYTYLDTEIRATGVPLPHSPRNQLFGRASLPLGPLQGWIEYSYEDEFALAASPFALESPETHQVDLGVSLHPARLPGLHRLPPSLVVSSEWINVTEEERIDSLGLPLPDQTLWYLRVRMSLP